MIIRSILRKVLFCISLMITSCLFLMSGCGQKKNGTGSGSDTVSVTNLIKKDSISGKEKLRLAYIVKKGDKFSYKMTAKTSTTENSPATEGKDVKQDNEINYFYSKEVQDVDQSGIISYKVKYDSIVINAVMGTQTIKYNSNVNDTIKSNPAFIQYNAVMNEPFFMRVAPDGEITDLYGLEKIYENLFKALGDTLKEEDKQTIKDTFGKESIKEIMQQEYQVFPKNEIMIDSSWQRSYNTQVLFFEVSNNAKYILKGIQDKDGMKFANIEAQLNVEFLSKEAKEQGVKFKIDKSETSGSGKISFNLNRGCITTKETSTNLNLELSLSAQGQSAKSKQTVSTNLNVVLLN